MKSVSLRQHVYIIALGAETGATFDPAALQDFLPRLRAVALHETVFSFTLTFVWLISSFWHMMILSILTNTCSSIPQISTFFKKFSTPNIPFRSQLWKSRPL